MAGGATDGAAPAERLGFMALWGPTFIRRTFVLWVLWFAMQASYFGIFIWLPGLLRAKGYTLHDAFLLTLIISIAQIPGYFSAAYLVERWGRKATLVVYLLLCAVGAYFFGQQTLSAQPDSTQILLWGSIISFFNLGAWGVVYTYTPELYPTKIRGTGTGWAAAFGRLGGMIAPAMVGWILAAFGGNQAIVFTAFTAILLLGGIVVLLFGEETKGLTLEQIAG
jgi:putative MFS transporter